MRPSTADIAAAIERAEKGGWIDPTDVPLNWFCELYDPEGQRAGNGNGLTSREAMALAWLHVWAPDALSPTCGAEYRSCASKPRRWCLGV